MLCMIHCNYTKRKVVWFFMRSDNYQANLEEFQRLKLQEQQEQYDDYFLIDKNELSNAEIIGIADVRQDEQLIMCKEDYMQYLIYNSNDDFYFINSSEEDKELIEETFGTEEYEVIDNHLIIKDDDKSLSNFEGIGNYHIYGNKDFIFEGDVKAERKEILTDHSEVTQKANEDLAERYRLPKDTFNNEITIKDIEEHSN